LLTWGALAAIRSWREGARNDDGCRSPSARSGASVLRRALWTGVWHGRRRSVLARVSAAFGRAGRLYRRVRLASLAGCRLKNALGVPAVFEKRGVCAERPI